MGMFFYGCITQNGLKDIYMHKIRNANKKPRRRQCMRIGRRVLVCGCKITVPYYGI